MKAWITLAILTIAAPAWAQPAPQPPKEHSALYDALAAEGEAIKESCTSGELKTIATCAATLATGQPFHLSFGSLAPQSGFGVGVAAVAHKNFTTAPWRLHASADAVAARGGSWRAGAYVSAIHVRDLESSPITVTFDDPESPDANDPYVGSTVYSAVVQRIVLNDLLFFGIGPDTNESSAVRWGLSQTVAGGRVYKPLPSGRANLSLVGAVTGRFVDARDFMSTPSARFVELTEGIRLDPTWFGRRVYPSYAITADQFVSDGGAKGSFNRLTIDLAHEFPLYKTSRSSRRFTSDLIGPNECSSADDGTCATPTRNRDGAISVRLLTQLAWERKDNTVPFYFQPTLGGGDINGSQLLSGFSDYRFRAPNLIVLQERFDRSLGFWEPLGFVFVAEQGKVATRRGDVSFADLEHSVSVGLTVRAGGFPQVLLLFSWSREGRHIGFTVNPSLLGGGSRPSLF